MSSTWRAATPSGQRRRRPQTPGSPTTCQVAFLHVPWPLRATWFPGAERDTPHHSHPNALTTCRRAALQQSGSGARPRSTTANSIRRRSNGLAGKRLAVREVHHPCRNRHRGHAPQGETKVRGDRGPPKPPQGWETRAHHAKRVRDKPAAESARAQATKWGRPRRPAPAPTRSMEIQQPGKCVARAWRPARPTARQSHPLPSTRSRPTKLEPRSDAETRPGTRRASRHPTLAEAKSGGGRRQASSRPQRSLSIRPLSSSRLPNWM